MSDPGFTLQTLSSITLVENENRKYSYLDLVRTPRMRRLALCCGIVWYWTLDKR